MAKKSDTKSKAGGAKGRRATIKRYRAQLIELRDELVDEVRTLSGYSLASSKQAGEELADVGSENFLREMELGLMSAEGRKVRLIQDALDRMDRGEYGICKACGKNIQEGRLEAIPYAMLCVGCKGKREQAARMGAPLPDDAVGAE